MTPSLPFPSVAIAIARFHIKMSTEREDTLVIVYKASIARAAAPMIPTAWVAWAAAPVNSETVEVEEVKAPEAE